MSEAATVHAVHSDEHQKHHNPAAQLQAIEPPRTVATKISFSFKTTTDPDTKEKNEKRPTIELMLPFVTFEGLIEALSSDDKKQQEFILNVVNDEITRAARQQVSPTEDLVKPVNSQDELDLDKLSIKYLANMPPSERRGGGIAKEVWEAFGKDYIGVMTSVGNKTLEQAQNAAILLVRKLNTVKTRKPVLEYLDKHLDFYTAHTENLEDYKEVVEFLKGKAEVYLKMDDETLLANLG